VLALLLLNILRVRKSVESSVVLLHKASCDLADMGKISANNDDDNYNNDNNII